MVLSKFSALSMAALEEHKNSDLFGGLAGPQSYVGKEIHIILRKCYSCIYKWGRGSDGDWGGKESLPIC